MLPLWFHFLPTSCLAAPAFLLNSFTKANKAPVHGICIRCSLWLRISFSDTHILIYSLNSDLCSNTITTARIVLTYLYKWLHLSFLYRYPTLFFPHDLCYNLILYNFDLTAPSRENVNFMRLIETLIYTYTPVPSQVSDTYSIKWRNKSQQFRVGCQVSEEKCCIESQTYFPTVATSCVIGTGLKHKILERSISLTPDI